MHKLNIVWGSLLLLFCSTVFSNGNEIGVKQYIELLNQHDPILKKLSVAKQQLVYFVDKQNQDAAFQIDLVAEKGFGDDGVDTSTLEGELSKEVVQSGTRFSLSHRKLENTDRDENLSEFRIEQDIFQNAFGNQYKTQQDIYVQEYSLSELEAQEQYEDYLTTKLINFFVVLDLQKERDLLKDTLKQAVALEDYVKQKLDKGAAYESDVMQVRLQLLQRKQQLLEVEQRLIEQKTELFSALVLPIDTLLLEHTFNPESLTITFNEQQLMSLRDYRIYEHYRSIGLNRYQLSKEENKADIKVYAAISQDDSSRFTNTVDRQETSFGVSLSKALASKKLGASENYQKLQADIDELELSVSLSNAQTRLRNLQSSLAQKMTEIELVEEKSRLASAIFADQRKRYERGRLNIDQLIESSDRLYNYQMELSSLRSQYQQHYIHYLEFTDQLVGFIAR